MTDETKEEMDEKTYNDNEDFEEELIESPLKRVLMVLFSPKLVLHFVKRLDHRYTHSVQVKLLWHPY